MADIDLGFVKGNTIGTGSSLPDSALNGDLFYNTSDNHIYQWDGTLDTPEWVDKGSIKGATGATGAKGDKGDSLTLSDRKFLSAKVTHYTSGNQINSVTIAYPEGLSADNMLILYSFVDVPTNLDSTADEYDSQKINSEAPFVVSVYLGPENIIVYCQEPTMDRDYRASICYREINE